MGQYHSVYNKTKKEKYSIGMAKLWEKVNDANAMAFLLILSNSNGRGGGDFYIPQDYNKKTYMPIPLIGQKKKYQDAINEISGRWAGDKIVVQGDYAEKNDPGFISEKSLETYTDITAKVLDAIEAVNSECNDEKLTEFVKHEREWRV